MTASQDIRRRIADRAPFSLAEVRRWMADDRDLDLWRAVYALLGKDWKRIRPEPDMEEACEFISRYLLRCVHEDVRNDDRDVPTGYEAANDLANCLKRWSSKLPETEPVLTATASRIADAYRAAADAERNRLLNGFLEHALESVAVRPFFERWRDDPVLGEPWRLAMEWAVSRPGGAR